MNTNSKPMKEVTAYADGSSLGNGQTTKTRAACAAILAHGASAKAFAEYIGAASNQQAEIRAAILAVRSLKEPCRLHVISDSKYVVATMTPGPGQFKRKANHELWTKLDEAIEAGGHIVTFQWTRGHSGNARQEAADYLAHTVSTAQRIEPFMLRRAVARFDAGREQEALPPMPPPVPTTGNLFSNPGAQAAA